MTSHFAVRKNLNIFLLFISILPLAACASTPSTKAAGPSAGSLSIGGGGLTARILTIADLKSFGETTINWSHRGVAAKYQGVAVEAILSGCGFEPGPREARPKDKLPGWRKVLLATARDGYQSVFTCAEVWPGMGPTRAFVVWERGGAPLPGDMGPLRVLVTTDGDGSRSIHGVESLQCIDLREKRD